MHVKLFVAFIGQTHKKKCLLGIPERVCLFADDAMAILAALNSPEVDIIGITTIFGNVTTSQATKNAFILLNLAGRPDVSTNLGLTASGHPSTVIPRALGVTIPGGREGLSALLNALSYIHILLPASQKTVQANSPPTNQQGRVRCW